MSNVPPPYSQSEEKQPIAQAEYAYTSQPYNQPYDQGNPQYQYPPYNAYNPDQRSSGMPTSAPAPSFSSSPSGYYYYSSTPQGGVGYPPNSEYSYKEEQQQQQQPPYSEVDNSLRSMTQVYNQSPQIRHAFIRKVYVILFCQIALTMGIGALFMYVDDIKFWIQKNYWLIWVNLIPTLITLFLLIWKRRQSPLNFILLVIFTILEAYTIGVIVSFYDEVVVLEALIITVGIFLGLTLFTFQTKIDFSGCAPFLFAAVFGLVILGLLQIFIRNDVLEIVYCSIGVVVFSGLIIYDTQRIIRDVYPDEYIMASVNLYLDVLNLFLFILRLFGRRG